MVLSEKSAASQYSGYLENLCNPFFLSSNALKTMERKPYHLDNGRNLIKEYEELLKKKGR